MTTAQGMLDVRQKSNSACKRLFSRSTKQKRKPRKGTLPIATLEGGAQHPPLDRGIRVQEVLTQGSSDWLQLAKTDYYICIGTYTHWFERLDLATFGYI